LPQLEFVDLQSSYGGHAVLDGINLSIEKGEVVSVIGPSGSGKSTLLRVLMGLSPARGGSVRLNGRTVNYADASAVRLLRSQVAMVFQQYNLFQNMTVLDNVTITPTKIKGWPRREVEENAIALLQRVGLGHRLHAYPEQLSGGQQQRVAIARALALKPSVLCLDEITAALDPELVREVLDTIRELAKDGITMLIVSHEMGFVREVSSKVIFMADGRIVETGSAEQLFDAPYEPRTREFVSKILRS